ncbi:beta strand repeat-containing protein [Prosthecobacter sp.]|uniref:beta strand repeat-containing protein n=1 Tax=Prosthecobacter sp. TaxID=1965333 RepID=UPI0037830AD0
MQAGSVSAILGGTAGLNKTTAGTVTLSGVNTYTGATSISAGTLQVNGSIAAGSTVGVGTSGTLTGSGTINGNATLTGSGIINLTNPGTIAGTLGVTGGNWNGAGSVSGLVTSSSGTFTVGSGANLTANGGLSVTGGTIASTDATSTITGSVNYTSASSSTFAGVIAGSGKTLTLNNAAATLTLSGTNTYTGATTITTGTLQVNGSLAAGSTVAVGTSGTLSGSGTINGNTTLTGSGIINLSSGTIAGTLGVNGGNWNGSGSVTGAVSSNSGTFTIGSGANLTANGGLSVTGGTIASGDATSTITGSVNYTSASSSTFAGVIAGSGNTVTMNNAAGTLILSGTNTYTGATTITAGTLQVNGSLAAGSTVGVGTSGTLAGSGTVNGNATLTGSGIINLTNPGTIAGTLGVTGGNWNGAGSVSGLVTSSSGTFTIGSGANLTANGNLNVTGGSIASGSSTSTITGSLNYTSASSSTFGGIIAGSGKTVTMNNAASTLTLSGASTYTGATTVSAGILNIRNATALGTTAGGTSVASGATLQIQGNITVGAEALTLNGGAASGQTGALVNVSGSNTFGGAVTVASSSSISAASGSTLTLTGGVIKDGTVATFNGGGTINVNTTGISGASANSDLVIDGTTVNLNVANTYNGPTFIRNSGTLNANVAGALPTATRTALTFDGTGTSVLTLGADQSVASLTAAGAATITLGSNTLTVGDASSNTTFAGAIGGTGGLTKDGASTQVLSASNGYSGTTTVSAGTLSITGDINSSATISVSGGLLSTSGADKLANTAAVTVSGGTLTVGGTDTIGTLTMSSGTIGGSSTLTATTYGLSGGTVNGNLGTGTINSSGNVALNGTAGATAVNITAGTLTLGSSDRLANGATVTVSGGTLAMGAFTDTVSIFNMSSGTLSGTGTLTATTYGLSGGTVDANLGTGTINSSGNVALNGTAAAGTVNVTAGTLTLGSSDRLANGATVTVSGGTLAMGAFTDTVSIFNMSSGTLSGTGTLTATTYGLSGGTVNANLGTGTINSSGIVALNGTAAAATVNVTAGTLTLGASSTINSATAVNISGGSLALGASNQIGNSAAVTVSGGTLAMGANSDTVASVQLSSGSITGSGTLTSTTTYDVRSGSVSAVLGGSVGLTKSTGGTVTLSNSNTYTGTTTVNGGTLALSGAGQLSDSSSLVVSGGTFDIGSVSDTVAGVQLTSGSISGTTGVLTSTTTYDMQNGTVGAILGGSVGLTKTTAGAVTLNGINTYTGATLLSAGDLTVNGSIASSSLTTINGGTLMGTGNVGAIQLNSGGAINPGGASTAGTLSTGNISIVDGQLHFNIGGTGSYDQISTTGTINLAAGGAGAKLVLDAISSYNATLNNAFTLVSNDLTDAITGQFAKGTFGGTKVITLSGVDYVENVLGSNYYGRINYSGSSGAPGTLATTGNDITLKIVTPEITVTESGNDQTDGGTYDYGFVDKLMPPEPVTKTFTIKNDGEVDLMGILVHAPTGPAASDYTLDTTGTATTLIPGASTTFTLTFSPSRIGTRNAAIVIDSNDLNENPFNLAITGVGSIARDVLDGWTYTYSGPTAPATPRNGLATAVAVQKSTTRDEAVAVFATGHTTNASGNTDIYTAKYEPVTGALLWSKTYNGTANGTDDANAIVVDGNGDVLITGYTTNGFGNADVYVAKYAGADGTLLWQKIYGGPGQAADMGNSIAVDAAGNVAVAGYGKNIGTDFFVAKYSSDGSTTYFERLIDGGSYYYVDQATSVAIDTSGNVAVAGYSKTTNNSNKDFRVMKLAAADGTTLWTWNKDGTTSNDDQAYSVAFTTAGEVVAAGTVHSASYDMFVVKLTSGGSPVWQKQWDSPYGSSDAAFDMAVTSAGDVVVAGASYTSASVQDGYAAKYNGSTGALVWDRRFNGPAGLQDSLTSLDLDALDNVVVTGYSENASQTYDVFTAKMLAADGGLLWERRFNGAADKHDYGYAVAISPDGNIFVGGYSTAAGDTTDFLVKNYEALKPVTQAAQTITFANPGTQSAGTPVTLSATASSGLTVRFSVVSGAAQIDDSSNTLLKFTGSGSVTIRASQSGSSTFAAATSVTQTFTVNPSSQTISFTLPSSLNSTAQWPLTGVASSGLAVTYSVQSGPGSIAGGILTFSGTGAVVVRASQAGDSMYTAAADVDATVTSVNHTPVTIFDNITENWRDRYAGTGAGVGNDIALQLSGNDAIAGIVGGYTTGTTGGTANKDIYLAKYQSDGTKVWTYIQAVAGDDEAMAVKVDASGDVYLAGYIAGTGQDLYVAKHSGADGHRIWFYTVNGAGNANDVGVSLDLEGTSNVVVGGYTFGTTTSNDFFAAKLAQTDGSVVWTSTQNRTTTTSDVPAEIVVGTDGSVALGGITGSDAWTVKLAAASGAKVWSVVYNFAGKPDAVRGIGMDAANNVIIAAYSQGANYDMYTAKYASQDGTLIWGKRYNSSFNSSDAPWDMVVDEDANVFVTGTSYRSASVRDGMTLKYSGLDGTLLWEGRYNGSSGGNDENTSISLDGIGNPVIGGYTTNADSTTDVYLAKHNKGAGDIRWQKTFDGDNNKNDSVKKVKVDPNGVVWMTGSATTAGGALEVLVLRDIPTP